MLLSPTAPSPLALMLGAIQEHLRRFFPPAQFMHAMVPDQADPAVWKQLTRRVPFLGVSWQGMPIDPASGRMLLAQGQFNVTLITRHSHVEARLLGDAALPGVVNMAWLAATVLQGHTVTGPDGVPLGTLSVTACSNAYARDWGEGEVAIASITLQAPLPTAEAAFGVGLPDLLEMGVTWDFPATDALAETWNVRP
jgi:hypothetical protein